jgi:hypothetical protein
MSSQQPLALGLPLGLPFPLPGGKDGPITMALPGFPPPPATPGKGKRGAKKAAGEEEDDDEEYVPEDEDYDDDEEEDGDDDDEEDANNQMPGGGEDGQPEFVVGPNGLRRRRKRLTRKWSAEEDMILAQLVAIHGQRDWGLIARHMPGRFRKGKQCRERWRNQVRREGTLVRGVGGGERLIDGSVDWVGWAGRGRSTD